jgi:hypothetical protein
MVSNAALGALIGAAAVMPVMRLFNGFLEAERNSPKSGGRHARIIAARLHVVKPRAAYRLKARTANNITASQTGATTAQTASTATRRRLILPGNSSTVISHRIAKVARVARPGTGDKAPNTQYAVYRWSAYGRLTRSTSTHTIGGDTRAHTGSTQSRCRICPRI